MASEEQTATPEPVQRDDGRVAVTRREWEAAAEAARKLVSADWLGDHLRPSVSNAATTASAPAQRYSLYEPSLKKIIGAALQAINQARLGYPEGTIVYQALGERLVAKRVWSERRHRLEWLVFRYIGGAEDQVEIDSATELPKCTAEDSWHIASMPTWPIGPEVDARL